MVPSHKPGSTSDVCVAAEGMGCQETQLSLVVSLIKQGPKLIMCHSPEKKVGS